MPKRLPLPPSPLTVWTADNRSAQICWGDLDAGPVVVRCGDVEVHLDHAGGPGAVVVEPLPADAELTATVSSRGATEELRFRTLATPPGELLSRAATVSDLHIGSKHWGGTKMMSEERAGLAGRFDHPAPYRSCRAAITEAQAWGAEHLLIKGDAVHHQAEVDFVGLGRLLDQFPNLPMSLVPGNHDVDQKHSTVVPTHVGERRLPITREVAVIDLPGIRLALGDSTIEGDGKGTVSRVGGQLLDAATEASGPVLMAVHQQLQPYAISNIYPPGVSGRESDPFLSSLAAANANTLFTSGHTHRNRVHAPRHGIVCAEVASTRDFPGVWAGYTAYEGGIVQTVRRIAAPDAIVWQEYSKNALLGLWGRWAPGTLSDRSFTHLWTGTGPK